MAKNAITDFSTTAASNTDVGGVDIQGTAPASNMDNAVREVMAILGDTNAGTAPWADTMTIGDAADLTKEMRFELSAITAGQTRVVTMPDANVTIPSGTLVTEAATQTLTNKDISSATNTYRSASTTVAGAVELATDAEAQTGTDTARAITAANLQAVTATETRKGVIELATTAEAAAGTDTARAVTAAGLAARFVAGTAQATTSGTAFDFTSIPSWVKRIVVQFAGVSFGSDHILVQLGDSGGMETTAYESASFGDGNNSTSTAGFLVRGPNAAETRSGNMVITHVGSNLWAASHSMGGSSGVAVGGGIKTLSGTLDRLRITTTTSSTFDAGSVNVMYE